MAIGRYVALALLATWITCAAVSMPSMVQLEMSTSVARSQVINALQGRYTALQALQTISDEDVSNRDITRNKATVEMELHSGFGSHTIQVTVGGQQRELIIDTGSGKTAFVCVGCSNCGNKRKHQAYVATDNTTYLSCDQSMTIPSSRGEPPCIKCENGKCKYGQKYVEGDHWTAYKASDIMRLSPSFEARIEFGCIYEQTGAFVDQPSDGIMGFSRHPDSIHEQLYRQRVTHTRIFSQCLTEGGGLLTIGGVDLARHMEPVRYTPLHNTGYQYWTVTLLSISVGSPNNTVKVDSSEYNADRGCVLDSGTTFFHLPQSVHELFRIAWRQAVGSLSLIPQSNSFYSMTPEQIAALPDICFWFKNDAHICMPSNRYFAQIGDGVYTGTIFFIPGSKVTILGASVLEGNDIIYDADNHRVGIARAMCDLPLQAKVELSRDPGGDKFKIGFDYSQASQWMLACVTLLAVAGLISAIIGATMTANKSLEDATRSTKVPLDATVVNEWQSEEFAFFLMQDNYGTKPM